MVNNFVENWQTGRLADNHANCNRQKVPATCSCAHFGAFLPAQDLCTGPLGSWNSATVSQAVVKSSMKFSFSVGCIIDSLKSRTTDRVGSYRVTDCQKLSWVSVTPMVQRVQAWMFFLNIWFKDTAMKLDRIQEFQIWNHNSNQTFKRISWRPGWNMERRLNRLSQLMDLYNDIALGGTPAAKKWWWNGPMRRWGEGEVWEESNTLVL